MLATLIIENNATSRESLKQILAARYPNVRAQEAANGEEALQTVANRVPDVVLMNIGLPDHNGLEVLREIRRQSSRIIIVVLGDHDIPEYREAALGSGADYFVSMWSSSVEEIDCLLGTVFLWARAMADEP